MKRLPSEIVTPLNAIMANYPRNSQAYKWAKEAKEAFTIYHVTFVGNECALPGLVPLGTPFYPKEENPHAENQF